MTALAYKIEPLLDADQLIARLNTDLMLIKLQSDNLMVMLNEQAKRDRDIRGAESSGANEVDEQAVIVRAEKES